MMSGIGISFHFGFGDVFDAAETPRRERTPTPPPERQWPTYRRPAACDCLSTSPDDSGGRWKMDGREYRRDAEGRVWVKKLPQTGTQQPNPPAPSQWKTPPSPGKPSTEKAPERPETPKDTATSSTESSPKVASTSKI